MNTLLPPAGRLWCWLVAAGLWIAGAGSVMALATVPSAPTTYVSDRAGLLDAGTLESLERTLAQFERETSNQLLVATFVRLPEGEALEDFTQRVAQAWRAGQVDRDNGLVLFVFRDDRKLRIEVGYGLEGAIPDTVAARIIANEIRPRFRANDYPGGIRSGVSALMAAVRGEYSGTGWTVAEGRNDPEPLIGWCIFLGLCLFLTVYLWRSLRDTAYDRSGRRRVWGPVHTGDWSGRHSGGGGGWTAGGGGGWSGGGGGGGFSGGGGSFGGGGASGGW